MHISMSSWWGVGEGGGERRGMDRNLTFSKKIAVKFPTLGKNVRSNITEIPQPRK